MFQLVPSSLVSHASLEFNFVLVKCLKSLDARASQGATDKEGIGMTKKDSRNNGQFRRLSGGGNSGPCPFPFIWSAAMQLQNFLPRLHHYPLPECLRFM